MLPLPGEERGLLTSSCSVLIAGQDSALTFIRLSLTDSEVERQRGVRVSACVAKGQWHLTEKIELNKKLK